jgi:hypothetical protein
MYFLQDEKLIDEKLLEIRYLAGIRAGQWEHEHARNLVDN